MPLYLAPSLTDQDLPVIEAHLDTIRARRLSAAITYAAGVTAKLSHKLEVQQRRIKAKTAQLGKAIAALDAADERVTRQLADLTQLLTDAGLTADLITTE